MKWPFPLALLIVSLMCGCQSTSSNRTPAGGKAPSGSPSNSDKGSSAGPGTNDDDGRLIVTGEGQGPLDAAGCIPTLDFHALRGHAIAVDEKRMLWVFAGAPTDRSAGISTCIDGQFVFRPIKPFGSVGDVPGPPWSSQGKIFVPMYAGGAASVFIVSNPGADAENWQVGSQSLALPGPVVGTAVASPDVMLFVEREPRHLALYKMSEDATGAPTAVEAKFPGTPERGLTVRADFLTGKWLAVFSSVEGVMVARAVDIVGPWSKAVRVHENTQGLNCSEATELPMFASDPASETLIAYSCADSLPLHFARISLPKD